MAALLGAKMVAWRNLSSVGTSSFFDTKLKNCKRHKRRRRRSRYISYWFLSFACVYCIGRECARMSRVTNAATLLQPHSLSLLCFTREWITTRIAAAGQQSSRVLIPNSLSQSLLLSFSLHFLFFCCIFFSFLFYLRFAHWQRAPAWCQREVTHTQKSSCCMKDKG